jgi:hypothetical protein
LPGGRTGPIGLSRHDFFLARTTFFAAPLEYVRFFVFFAILLFLENPIAH